MSAFVPADADDAVVQRLILLGGPDARWAFAKEIGAKGTELFVPLSPEALVGMRGPGVAVVCGIVWPPDRIDRMTGLLRVQGFDVLTAGGPGVLEAARAHLGRLRRQASGQLTMET